MIIVYQILACFILVILSAFFAGSETGVYCLSRFRLRVAIQQKLRFAELLDKVMDDSNGLVLSMLILNNLVNCLTTSIVTFMILAVASSEQAAQLYATVLIAPLLFVFGEVIPKNIYYHHADTLMRRFSPILWLFQKIFTITGILTILKAISRLIMRLLNIPIDSKTAIATRQKQSMRQIMYETQEEGILSKVQHDIINRLMTIQDITAAAVMTKIADNQMVEINSTRIELLDKLKKCQYTRLPVYQANRENIIGYINIYESLTQPDDFHNVRRFLRPITKINARTSVINAMNTMRKENQNIILVTSDHRRNPKPLGIITMKDLVEELTGELSQW